RVPERIGAVVWLAAVVTHDGESLLDAVPQTEWTARAATLLPDGTAQTDHVAMLDAILQDGTPEDRAWVLARHRDYPKHALVEPGRLRAFLALGLPTAYIAALDDRTIPLTLARAFADRLGGARWDEVPGSHDAMVSRPREVAAALVRVAQATGRIT